MENTFYLALPAALAPPPTPLKPFHLLALSLSLSPLQPFALLSLFPTFTAADSEKNAHADLKKRHGTCGLFSFPSEIIMGVGGGGGFTPTMCVSL